MNLTWRWPWAILIAAVAVCVIVVLWMAVTAWLGRRHGPETGAVVYGLERDFNTDYASRMLRRWRSLNRMAAAGLAVSLVFAVILVARPSQVGQEDEQASGRDIVLCLDVSPSMLAYDHEVLGAYQKLTASFKGERIALSLFNSTSRTLFPLTDDYTLVSSQLKHAGDILGKVSSQDKIDTMDARTSQEFSNLIEGTQNRKDVTSLIGDGLVSCAAMLPGFTYGGARNPNSSKASQRPKSIVLATDNVSGKSTYTLDQALDLADKAGISVNGMYSGSSQSQNDKTTRDMKREIEGHGGTFSMAAGDRGQNHDSVANMVDGIEKKHTREREQARRSAMLDTPGWWTLALALFLMLYLVSAWRLKR